MGKYDDLLDVPSAGTAAAVREKRARLPQKKYADLAPAYPSGSSGKYADIAPESVQQTKAPVVPQKKYADLAPEDKGVAERKYADIADEPAAPEEVESGKKKLPARYHAFKAAVGLSSVPAAVLSTAASVVSARKKDRAPTVGKQESGGNAFDDAYVPYGFTALKDPRSNEDLTNLLKMKHDMDRSNQGPTYMLPDELRKKVNAEAKDRQSRFDEALNAATPEAKVAYRREQLFTRAQQIARDLKHFENAPNDYPAKAKLISEFDQINAQLHVTDGDFEKRAKSGRATTAYDLVRYGEWSTHESQRLADAMFGGNVEQMQRIVDNKRDVETAVSDTLPEANGKIQKGWYGLLGSAGPMAESMALAYGTAGTGDKAYWARQGTGEIFSMWLEQDGRRIKDIPKEELDRAIAIAQSGGAIYGGIEYVSGFKGVKFSGATSLADKFAMKFTRLAWENPKLRDKLIRGGIQAVMSWLGETAEEGGQQSAQQFAIDMMSGDAVTLYDSVAVPFAKGSWEAKETTAGMALLFGGAGAGLERLNRARERRMNAERGDRLAGMKDELTAYGDTIGIPDSDAMADAVISGELSFEGFQEEMVNGIVRQLASVGAGQGLVMDEQTSNEVYSELLDPSVPQDEKNATLGWLSSLMSEEQFNEFESALLAAGELTAMVTEPATVGEFTDRQNIEMEIRELMRAGLSEQEARDLAEPLEDYEQEALDQLMQDDFQTYRALQAEIGNDPRAILREAGVYPEDPADAAIRMDVSGEDTGFDFGENTAPAVAQHDPMAAVRGDQDADERNRQIIEAAAMGELPIAVPEQQQGGKAAAGVETAADEAGAGSIPAPATSAVNIEVDTPAVEADAKLRIGGKMVPFKKDGDVWVNQQTGSPVSGIARIRQLDDVMANGPIDYEAIDAAKARKEEVEQQITQWIDESPILSVVRDNGGVRMPKVKPGESYSEDYYARIPKKWRASGRKRKLGQALDQLVHEVWPNAVELSDRDLMEEIVSEIEKHESRARALRSGKAMTENEAAAAQAEPGKQKDESTADLPDLFSGVKPAPKKKVSRKEDEKRISKAADKVKSERKLRGNAGGRRNEYEPFGANEIRDMPDEQLIERIDGLYETIRIQQESGASTEQHRDNDAIARKKFSQLYAEAKRRGIEIADMPEVDEYIGRQQTVNKPSTKSKVPKKKTAFKKAVNRHQITLEEALAVPNENRPRIVQIGDYFRERKAPGELVTVDGVERWEWSGEAYDEPYMGHSGNSGNLIRYYAKMSDGSIQGLHSAMLLSNPEKYRKLGGKVSAAKARGLYSDVWKDATAEERRSMAADPGIVGLVAEAVSKAKDPVKVIYFGSGDGKAMVLAGLESGKIVDLHELEIDAQRGRLMIGDVPQYVSEIGEQQGIPVVRDVVAYVDGPALATELGIKAEDVGPGIVRSNTPVSWLRELLRGREDRAKRTKLPPKKSTKKAEVIESVETENGVMLREDAAEYAGGVEPEIRDIDARTDLPEKVIIQTTRAKIKRDYPDMFAQAKAGDIPAAIDLVELVAKRDKAVELGAAHPGAKLLPVIALENTGNNMIPLVYAEFISAASGLEVVDNVFQANIAGRTGKNAVDRIISQVMFAGPIESGTDYILVDDHVTAGGTFADLAAHVTRAGGRVVGATALTASRGSTNLALSDEVLAKLEGREDYEQIKSILNEQGKTARSLTLSEARQISRFKDADSLRTAVADAIRERSAAPGSGTVLSPVAEYTGGLGYFSQIARSIAGFNQDTFTPSQLKAMVSKAPGVKAEELDDLGFNDWLDDVDGKVTKQQALDFVRAGGPQVEEVVKSENNPAWAVFDPDGMRVGQYYSSREEADLRAQSLGEDYTIGDANLDLSQDTDRGYIDETKFVKYTLPGGTNYRELLLKLESKMKPLPESEILELNRRLKDKGYGPLDEGDLYDLRNPSSQTIALLYDMEDRLGIDTIEARTAIGQFDNDVAYMSSHWDEMNVIAHIRLNDRIGLNGEKILLIEEIQSDWHQEGRKRGYHGSAPEKIAELNRLMDERKKLLVGRRISDVTAEYDALTQKIDSLHDEIVEVQSGVPDAPFKKSWAMLAFKRALKMAVDGGYDAVAWTPGDVQVERYDLSKQVDSIEAQLLNDGTYDVRVYQDDQLQPVVKRENQSESQLEDLVGKEIAQRIIDETDQFDNEISLSGDGLKVGGEGMKGFYDKILPKAVQKYVKKMGGKVGREWIKVGGEGRTGSSEVWNLPITDAMRGEVEQGQSLYENENRLDPSKVGEYLKKRNVEDVEDATSQLELQWEEVSNQAGGAYASGAESGTAGGAVREGGSRSKLPPKRDRQAEAIADPADADALAEAFKESGRISSLVHEFLNEDIPSFDYRGVQIQHPKDFAALMMPLRSPYIESLKVAFLDKDRRIISARVVTVGLLDSSPIHQRELLRGMPEGTAGVMISHNHPSGDPAPSQADVNVTKKLRAGLRLAGVSLVDHVITNGGKYVSLNELGFNEFDELDTSVESPLSGVEKRKVPEMRAREPWERVERNALKKSSDPGQLAKITAALRQADGNYGHIIYVNHQNAVIAIERVPLDMDAKPVSGMILRGATREGASAYFMDWPVNHTVSHVNFMNRLIALSDEIDIPLIDISTLDKMAENVFRERGRRGARGFFEDSVRENSEQYLTQSQAEDLMGRLKKLTRERDAAAEKLDVEKKVGRFKLKKAREKASNQKKIAIKKERDKTVENALNQLRDFGVTERKLPKTIKGVPGAAFKQGERVEREKGYIRALKDAFGIALDAKIKEFRKTTPDFESNPGPTINLLERLSATLDGVLQHVGGVIDSSDKQSMAVRDGLIRNALVDFFGPEYYLLIRRATVGGRSATFTSLREWTSDKLVDFYAKGVEYQLEHIDIKHMPDSMKDEFDSLIKSSENSLVVHNLNRLHEARSYLKKLRHDKETDSRIDAQKRKVKRARADLKKQLKDAESWDGLKLFYEGLARISAQQDINRRYAKDARKGLVQENAEQIAEEAQVVKKIKRAEDGDPRRRWFGKALRNDFSASMRSMAKMLAGGKPDSVSERVLAGDIESRENAALTDIAAFTTEFDNLRKKHGISDFNILSFKSKPVDREIGGETVSLTQAELMNIYAHMQDPEALQALAWGVRSERFKKNKERTFQMRGEDGRVDPDITLWEVAKMVNRELTDSQKAFVRDVIALKNTPDVIAKANAMAFKTEGVWLFFNQNHWRLNRAHEDKGDSPAEIMDYNAYRQMLLDQGGFKRDRTLNRHVVFASDFFQEAEDQVRVMSFYSNMADVLRVAWETMENSTFKSAVVQRFGTSILQDIKNRMLETAHLRRHQDQLGKWARFGAKVERRLAAGILALRLTTILANRVGGSVMAWSQLRAVDKKAARRFVIHNGITPLNTPGNKRIVEKLLKHGYLFNRWRVDPLRTFGQLGIDTRDEMFKSRWSLMKRKTQQMMLHPMASAELRNTVNLYKALTRSGYSEPDAIDLIVRLTRRTQNPSSPMDETTFYADLKESGWGVWMPFMGQPTVIQNLWMDARMELSWARKHGTKEQRKTARRMYAHTVFGIVISAVVMAAIREAFKMARNGGPPDDEEKLKDDAAYMVTEAASEVLEGYAPGGGRLVRFIAPMFHGKGSPMDRIKRQGYYGSDDFDTMPVKASFQLIQGGVGVLDAFFDHLNGDSVDDVRLERNIVKLLNGASQWSGGLLPPGGLIQASQVGFGLAGHPLGKKRDKIPPRHGSMDSDWMMQYGIDPMMYDYPAYDASMYSYPDYDYPVVDYSAIGY